MPQARNEMSSGTPTRLAGGIGLGICFVFGDMVRSGRQLLPTDRPEGGGLGT